MFLLQTSKESYNAIGATKPDTSPLLAREQMQFSLQLGVTTTSRVRGRRDNLREETANHVPNT